MQTYVIMNHYCKDGQSKLYYQGTFSCNKVDDAVNYFKSKRFFIAGTYRLFFVEKKELENGVIVDIIPSFLDIEKCLMTRVCKWDEGGNFSNKLFLGLDKVDFTHDELIHVFKVNLPHTTSAEPTLDFTTNDGGIF